jgi:hypothetical protein
MFLGALPVAQYAGARVFGSPPSEATWIIEHPGGNHGPWWDAAQGLAIYLSDLGLVVLLVVTVAGSIFVALTKRRTGAALVGLVLAAFQVAIALSHFWWLFWTID